MDGKLNRNPVGVASALFYVGIIGVPLLVLTLRAAEWIDVHSFAFQGGMLRLLAKTILWTLLSAAGATLGGSVLALAFYKTSLQSRRWLFLVFLLPVLVPSHVWAVAWKNVWYMVFENTPPAGKIWPVIWVWIWTYMPLTFVITGTALQRISPALEESALISAPVAGVVRHILFPLLRPSLTVAFVLTFVFILSDYAVPTYWNVHLFTTEIFTRFAAFYQYRIAIVQSLVLVAAGLSFLWPATHAFRHSRFLPRVKGMPVLQYNRFRSVAIGLIVLWLIIGIVFPLGTLTGNIYPHGWYWMKKAFVLLFPAFAANLWQGGLIVMGLLLPALGFLTLKKYAGPVMALVLTGFAVPSMIWAIGFTGLLQFRGAGWLYGKWWIPFAAYAAKYSYIPLRMIYNAGQSIPPTMIEAAQLSGINAYNRFRYILFPFLRPALLAGALIVFLLISGDVAMALLLHPPGAEWITVKSFNLSANTPGALSNALVCWNLIFVLAAGWIFYIFMNKISRYYSLIR